MIEIVPSVVAYNLDELCQRLNVLEAFSPWAHLDITDGRFTKSITWQEPSDLEIWEGKIKLEAHLMVETPEVILPTWLQVVDRVIIHTESTELLAEIVDSIEAQPALLGLALNLETPVKKVLPYLTKINFIHLMSIKKIGHYGEPFNEEIFAKIKELKEAKANLTISVDGGVNKTNFKKLIEAGANHLVVGSAIWQAADPAKAYKDLHDALNWRQNKIFRKDGQRD